MGIKKFLFVNVFHKIVVMCMIFLTSCNLATSYEKNTVVINEFVTQNSGVDSIYDKDNNSSDWIELYNWGQKPVSLSGLYITDNKDQKMKTPLPPLIVEPGDYVVMWGGSGKNAPFEHLGFKLSENDDGIFIYSSAGDMIDGIFFDNYISRADTSFARFPDGALNWVYSSDPTPLNQNIGK